MSDKNKDAPGRVRPAVPKGFRDVMAGEVLLRNRLIDTIRAVFERFGFGPLETPSVERLDVLTGKYGDEGASTLFRFETADEEQVGLRFDLTVPLARVVAQHRDLPRPFRRYQVAPVWRFDKPGPGRYREFLQFDIDTVGSRQVAADVEIMAAVLEAFQALGILDSIALRVSSRRLLNVLVRWAGLPDERAVAVFRVLDKLDRYGRDEVRRELTVGRVDASGAKIPGLGLDDESVGRIDRFLDLAGTGRRQTLDGIGELLTGTDGFDEAQAELEEIHAQLEALGWGDERVTFDPTLARGLDYYTGPIFEAHLPKAPEFGTVFGGGRYDGLVERFSGETVPGTGGSIGVDRLLAALIHLGAFTPRRSTSEVLVTVFDRGLMIEYQKIAAELRAAGIPTEVYLGQQRGLRKQLGYADRIGARVALLLGEDERARGEVTIKDLVSGSEKRTETASREQHLEETRAAQVSVARTDLVAKVRQLLDREAPAGRSTPAGST